MAQTSWKDINKQVMLQAQEKSQNTSTIFLAPGQFFPKKGARLFKILYRQIGGIPKCVDIFQKKSYHTFLDV